MIRTFAAIPIDLSPKRVMEHLYPPGPARSGRHSRSQELASEAATLALELITPAGAVRMIPADELAPWPPTARGDFLFVGLATLGAELDAAGRALQANGDDTRALFLDAAGAVAVESTCDVLDDAIERECRRHGVNKTRRASPGYGAFPLGDQRRIFDLLPAQELGVSLTAECMMTPLKSVSFVVLAGENPQLVRADLTCDACPLVNCTDRSTSRRCLYREDDP